MRAVPRGHHGICLCLIALLVLPVGADRALGAGGHEPLPSFERLTQRGLYRDALSALAQGNQQRFAELAQHLQTAGYPLAPYLALHAAQRDLDGLDADALNELLVRYPELPLSARLRDAWLLRQGERSRWQPYLQHYQPTSNARRRCYFHRAQHAAGDVDAALAGVPELWIVERSQPDACDPLFELWIESGGRTEAMIWERLQKVLATGNLGLARYLQRQFASGSDSARLGAALLEAHQRPRAALRATRYRKDTPAHRVILTHAVQRLSRSDADAAAQAWHGLRERYRFGAARRARVEQRLLLAAAADNRFPGVKELAKLSSEPDASTTEWLARYAVRHSNWEAVWRWTEALSDSQAETAEWRYWRAQANRHLGGLETGAQPAVQRLAGERHYYGFLAAEEIGSTPRLNHEPSRIPASTRAQIAGRAGFVRALELYAVGDLLNARREWRAAFAGLTTLERAAAAQLARDHGWLDQAIRAANAAALQNDLDLRFPLAYGHLYAAASRHTRVPVPTLLAMTRQESAFEHRARSSANARGLMQLLPSTARFIARNAGWQTPTLAQLYEPDVNIRIASAYLARLLERYDHQRPLAFAAYNAGERRVDRWIRDREGMPMPIWIENIPFAETRGYVKSVMAFNHLYALRMERSEPLLFPHEQRVKGDPVASGGR